MISKAFLTREHCVGMRVNVCYSLIFWIKRCCDFVSVYRGFLLDFPRIGPTDSNTRVHSSHPGEITGICLLEVYSIDIENKNKLMDFCSKRYRYSLCCLQIHSYRYFMNADWVTLYPGLFVSNIPG
jgi:hypothetical protein